jgi:hypothetical protein
VQRRPGGEYALTVPYSSDGDLDKTMDELLGNISSEANDRNCFSKNDAHMEGLDRHWGDHRLTDFPVPLLPRPRFPWKLKTPTNREKFGHYTHHPFPNFCNPAKNYIRIILCDLTRVF